jgi:hypothetical protein
MPAQPYTISSSLEERLKGRRAALEALRNLPEGFQLYYSPALRKEDHADPTVDYIVAHKEKGLLGIVVKSGEIVEEPGGFISQYQPQKQLYKIMDPVKPADLAIKSLLDAFDKDAHRVYPCGVAVLFPDTMSHEFSEPKTCYLFAEDLTAGDFPLRLVELFLEAVDVNDLAKFRNNYGRLGTFLKAHSDNAAVFEETTQRLKQVSALKATPPAKSPLRMKVAMPPPVAFVEPKKQKPKKEPKLSKAAQEKALVAAALAPMEPEKPGKPLVIAKAEKVQAPIAVPVAESKLRSSLRAAPPEVSRQRDMFMWLEEVQERGEGNAWLTTGQWLMAAGLAVFVICAIYFMARNFAIATAAG